MANNHLAILALLLCFVAAAFAGTATISFSNPTPYWGQMQRITFKVDVDVPATGSSLLLTSTTSNSGQLFVNRAVSPYCFAGSQVISSAYVIVSGVATLQVIISPADQTAIPANTEFYCDFRINPNKITLTDLSFAISVTGAQQTIKYSGDKMSVPTVAQLNASNFSTDSSSGNSITQTIPFGLDFKMVQQIGYLTVAYKSLPPNMLIPLDVTAALMGESLSLLSTPDFDYLTDVLMSQLWDWVKIYPSQDVRLYLYQDRDSQGSYDTNQVYLLTGPSPADGSVNLPFPTDAFAITYYSMNGEYSRQTVTIQIGELGLSVQSPSGARYTSGYLDIFDKLPNGVVNIGSGLAITQTSVATVMTIIALDDMTSPDTVNTQLKISVSGDVTFDELIGTSSESYCSYNFQGIFDFMNIQSASSDPFSRLKSDMMMSTTDMKTMVSESGVEVALQPGTNEYNVSYPKAALMGLVLCFFAPSSDLSTKSFSVTVSIGKYSQTYKSEDRFAQPLQLSTTPSPATVTAGKAAFTVALSAQNASDLPESSRIDTQISLSPPRGYEIRSPSAPYPVCTSSTPGITISTGKVDYPNLSDFQTAWAKIQGSVKAADFPIKLSCTQDVLAFPIPAAYQFYLTTRSSVGSMSFETSNQFLSLTVPAESQSKTYAGKTQFTITTSMPLTSQAELDAILTKFVEIMKDQAAFADIGVADVLVSQLGSKVNNPYVFNPFDASLLFNGLFANANIVQVWLPVEGPAAGFYSAPDGSFNVEIVRASLTAVIPPVVFPSKTAASFFYATNRNLECYSNAQCSPVQVNSRVTHDATVGLCWKGKCIQSFDDISFLEYTNIGYFTTQGGYAVPEDTSSSTSSAILAQVSMVLVAIIALALF